MLVSTSKQVIKVKLFGDLEGQVEGGEQCNQQLAQPMASSTQGEAVHCLWLKCSRMHQLGTQVWCK